jgi:hypothetical protein
VRECLDCPEQNIFVETSRLRGMNWVWQQNIVRPCDCTHERFEVDRESVVVAREQSLTGLMFVMLTAKFFDGAQYHYYHRAKAECKRCGLRFYVRAETTTKWENQKRVTKEGEWTPVKIKRKTEERHYVDEYERVIG